MSKRVAVLGCGPAGLLAAHAVRQAGHEVDVLSKRQPSVLGGAQFLHECIPGVNDTMPSVQIDFMKLGTEADYARKVYGAPDAPTSWSQFNGSIVGWSLQMAYDRLWTMYESRIIDCTVDKDMIRGLVNSYQMVVSSVPLPVVCHEEPHIFRSQKVFIRNVDIAMDEAFVPMADNTIVYCGYPEADWYRASKIFGVASVEHGEDWPGAGDHCAYEGQVEVKKPLATNCGCWSRQDTFMTVGRFGSWKKGVLVNDAYREVRDAMRVL